MRKDGYRDAHDRGLLREEVAEECANARDYWVIVLLHLLILGRGGLARSCRDGRRRLLCNRRRVFDASLKNQGWANTHAAYQHNQLGIEIIALRFGARVVREGRPDDLVDRRLVCWGLRSIA